MEDQAATAIPVCGIGASAGGVYALRTFFQLVPDNLGLAYVVIVHLAPDHPSALSEILATATNMPVLQVCDTPTLKPNCIYVIAPDSELVIEGDEVKSRPFTEERWQRAPIDMFFRSIANGRGDGMAVILTGSGADGAEGAKAMKEAGGVIFVQDPAEAEFPPMPQNAIATGCADFVAPITGLIERIIDIAHSKEAVRSLDVDDTANDLRKIIGFLHARTGHDFASYKRSTVRRRVLRRMQVCRLTSLPAYADYLRSNPEEAVDLFRDMLISVTQFFRDADAFVALQKKAIATVFDDLHDDGIRIWVAGCATGEEAYSMAMLIMEEAEHRKLKVPVQIFATDLDEGALATAREGRYLRSIEDHMSAARLQRFFIADGACYRVRADIREMVLFASHSVLKDPPFLRLDIVSCRNLLIYLERSLQEKLLSIFHYALRPNRFLFLGSAETADVAQDLFTLVDREARLYSARNKPVLSVPVLAQRFDSPAVHIGEASRGSTAAHVSSAALHEQALERMAPPSVLVDDRRQIAHLSPSAGRYVRHSGGVFSARLDYVVRPELRLDLGHALTRALEKGTPSLTLAVAVDFDGQRHRIAMNVVPILDGERSAPQALVLFLDDGPDTSDDSGVEETARPDEFRRLYAEMKVVQEALATSRADHELAVQELRAANEELQSMNEEYRSTSEELETSKEELQSMNEELQTVNSELKSKLENISTAHNDLRNLTAATEIGTLFLDGDLHIRMFTPPVADLFNITEGDIGRSLTDFTHRLAYDGVERDVRKVLRELTPVEGEVLSHTGQCFMMRVRPYRTFEERIEGVVISFVDISTWRETETQLNESERRYRTLFESLDQGFCVVELIHDSAGQPVDCRFIEVNPTFQRQTGLADPIGQTMRSLATGHEGQWQDAFARIARTWSPERFEAPWNDSIFDVYAFPFGQEDKRQVGILFDDITARKQAEHERELLTHELSHRVKNTLAVVQGLANQTSRQTASVEEFRKGFIGRLAALGKAHSLLLDTQWQSADLHKLVEMTLEAYDAGDRDMVTVEGPSLDLPPKHSLGLALILHELSCNAAKYGALSVPNGRLAVSWTLGNVGGKQGVHLHWQEIDGPPVKPPGKKGFGSRLIERACTYELEGAAELDFAPAGFSAHITFPID